jgi:hypothetical protein
MSESWTLLWHARLRAQELGSSHGSETEAPMPPSTERWPPVYDAEGLVAEIKRLTERDDLEPHFYDWRRDRSVTPVPDVCQGDVVRLASDVPVIDESGQAVARQTRRHRRPRAWPSRVDE